MVTFCAKILMGLVQHDPIRRVVVVVVVVIGCGVASIRVHRKERHVYNGCACVFGANNQISTKRP